MFGFGAGREVGERALPHTVEVGPEHFEPRRVDRVDASGPHGLVLHEAGPSEHLEVQGDSGATYWQLLGQLGHGSRPLNEQVDDGASGPVAKSVEHRRPLFVSVH